MVTHCRPSGRLRRLAFTVAALGSIGILSFASACDKVPLLAPSGTIINIFPSSTTVAANGEIDLIATVIENGVASTPSTGTPGTPTATSSAGAGTPVHNGTLVSFTSTIGRIEPREARTHNGEVRVRFIANGQSGTATITAYSGGASGKLENLLVGTAAAGRITVTATQQTLGSAGGSTEVLARVETTAGSPVAGVPVTFTTTTGTVNPTSAVTDANGIARSTLTTSTQATVTATAGAQTGNVQVGVTPSLGLGLTVSPNPATAGVPTTFSITSASTGGIARDAIIDFGDGQQRALGNISGTTTIAHVYNSPGTYTATLSATDAGGSRQTQTTAVIVGALGVTIQATGSTVNSPITFRATVTGGANVPVSRYRWTFDDGTVQETSGPETTRTFPSGGTKTVRVDVIGVNGQTIGTATTQINVT